MTAPVNGQARRRWAHKLQARKVLLQLIPARTTTQEEEDEHTQRRPVSHRKMSLFAKPPTRNRDSQRSIFLVSCMVCRWPTMCCSSGRNMLNCKDNQRSYTTKQGRSWLPNHGFVGNLEVASLEGELILVGGRGDEGLHGDAGLFLFQHVGERAGDANAAISALVGFEVDLALLEGQHELRELHMRQQFVLHEGTQKSAEQTHI